MPTAILLADSKEINRRYLGFNTTDIIDRISGMAFYTVNEYPTGQCKCRYAVDEKVVSLPGRREQN